MRGFKALAWSKEEKNKASIFLKRVCW